MKFCNQKNCEQLNPQPLKNFYKRSKSKDGLQSKCKFCEATYRKLNPEIYRENTANWKEQNVEYRRQYVKTYQLENPGKCNALTAKRKADKLQRTPKWLTKSDKIEMRWAYEYASQLSKETGIKYHVDHIIPLKGKNISGLHCPQNLRIIPATDNCRKGNRF